MKKIVNKVLVIIFATICIVHAQDGLINIFMNSIKIDNSQIKMINNCVYVPLRWVCNIMGYSVIWDGEKNNILVNKYEYPEYKAVEIDGKYGYVDENGEVVIEPQYHYARDFSEGLAYVQLVDGEKIIGHYINTEGKTIIDHINPYSYGFHDGIAILLKYTNDYEPIVGWASTDRNFKTYYVDKCGNMLFGRYFGRAGEFHDGFAYVQIEGQIVPSPGIKNIYTYIDMTGNYATDLRFDYAGDFENGQAKVIKNGVRGVVDTYFNFTPCEWKWSWEG